jgi:hypothetical protein
VEIADGMPVDDDMHVLRGCKGDALVKDGKTGVLAERSPGGGVDGKTDDVGIPGFHRVEVGGIPDTAFVELGGIAR